jgi:AIR synthase-related protein
MDLTGHNLTDLVRSLRCSRALQAKQDIQQVARSLGKHSGTILNGDDAAALPDDDGYTLIAAEGMLPSFVQAEPWFAGFCAVMTNVSDIAAMGGRARAIVDVLFAGADAEQTDAVLAGLGAGADMFGVPIVGGHTGRGSELPYLSAAIVGKARRLITSFAARPGDVLLVCIDLRGQFRADTGNFDAVSGRDPRDIRGQLALLPQLAEAELVHAGKDISMAGLVGTLLMLLETSGCGALLDLAAVPSPAAARSQPLRWLQAFPSYGYLLAARPAHAAEVSARFADMGVSATVVAQLRPGSTLSIQYQDQTLDYWDLSNEALLGFGRRTQQEERHA